MPEQFRQEQDTNELENLTAKCEEYLAGWKRAQADYANLVKETERARRDFNDYATEQSLKELFPVFDLLQIAVDHVPDFKLSGKEKTEFDAWFGGLKAIKDQWETAFKNVGLERVPTDGTMFDPSVHEVLMTATAEAMPDATPGTITKTVNIGWRLHGKLIKPARVLIQPET